MANPPPPHQPLENRHLENRIDALEDKVNSIKDMLEVYVGRLEHLDSRFSRLNTRFPDPDSSSVMTNRGSDEVIHRSNRGNNNIRRINNDLYEENIEDRGGRRFYRNYEPETNRRVQINVPEFDGRLDPNAFLDWLDIIEEYFEWHEMADEYCFRFAKLKLIGPAKKFWQTIEHKAYLKLKPIRSWESMKMVLHEKYVPPSFKSQLKKQLLNLKQGSSSVAEYHTKFDELILRTKIDEDDEMTISRFVNGLRIDIQEVVELHPLHTMADAYHKALEVESHIQRHNSRRTSSYPVYTPNHQTRNSTRTTSHQQSYTPRTSNLTSQNPSFTGATTSSVNPRFNSNRERPTGPFNQNSNNPNIVCHNCHSKGHIARVT